MKISHLNRWLPIALTIVLISAVSLSSMAYEPGVEELHLRITALEAELVGMESDSTSKVNHVLAIKDSIIALQSRIVEIKETTISGLQRQQSSRTDNRETLGMIAFGMLMVAALSIAFVLLFGKRLKLQEGSGVMQVLANDLQATISPEEEKNKGRIKVHFLVWISAIIMFVSMVMYLFRVL